MHREQGSKFFYVKIELFRLIPRVGVRIHGDFDADIAERAIEVARIL